MHLRNRDRKNDNGPAMWWAGSLLALTMASALQICSAAETRMRFDQPAQPLAAALQAIAKASGPKLLYADAAVQGLEAAPLHGSCAVEEALRTVLGDSGLSYDFVGQNMVAVKDTAERKKPKTDNAEPTVLEEMVVIAKPTDETSYNIRNATTATKTDTPIFDTPVSVQVVPRQVLDD